jgi:hypothetical protein
MMGAQCRGTIVGAQCAGGTMWGHNVGAQGGHNVAATVAATVAAQCRGTINLWGHGMPCPHIDCIDCCHLLPFHAMPFYAIPCPPMPCPTMLLPPCYHAAIPPPCYHAMTPPHALPLPFHATAAICCHPCHPMLCPTMLLLPCTILPPCHITPPCYHAMTHHMPCPQIQETHTMVGAQWWRHNRGHNVGAHCGHTVGIQW